MRKVLALIVLCFGFGTEAAAAAAPAPVDCAKAYELISRVRGREREMNYDSEKDGKHLNFDGLGRYAGGYGRIDFEARASDLAKRYKSDFEPFGIMGIAMDLRHETVDGVMMEGSAARLNTLLSPANLYQQQYPLFARVHECDIAYNFTPALGVPPPREKLAEMLKNAMDREREQHDAHVENLSDLQCTMRFAVAAQLSPAGSPAQSAMAERYNGGLAKVVPTFGDMPQERIKERLQGEAQDVARHLQNKDMTPSDLVEEVHACERRFGMPMSDLQVQN